MIRDERLYLDDILESINLIHEYLEGVSENEFHMSREKQDSIVRRIEIIGEATKSISSELKEQNQQIPWEKMAGMRNVLIHEYFGINWVTVWKTATQFIPPLKMEIENLINKLSQ